MLKIAEQWTNVGSTVVCSWGVFDEVNNGKGKHLKALHTLFNSHNSNQLHRMKIITAFIPYSIDMFMNTIKVHAENGMIHDTHHQK